MLTPCRACGHHVRRHGPSGCTAHGCGCQVVHDALAKRANRRISPLRVTAVWARPADDLTYHAVPIAGDRRQTPPPRRHAICSPWVVRGAWRRPFQLSVIPGLRCVDCLAALPRWTQMVADGTPAAPTVPTAPPATAPTTPAASPSPLPLGAYRDPRDPCVVFVPLRIDPRRADYSARDVEAALARLR